MAYVAVTLALRDREPDAAGAWQTALIDGSDLPEIYDWLAQSLLRQHSLPEAQAILQEATQRWPADARFTGPLASLYATFGRGIEARKRASSMTVEQLEKRISLLVRDLEGHADTIEKRPR